MNAVVAGDEIHKLLEEELAGRYPDRRGRFGPFGGRYVPETLVPALDRLEEGVAQFLHAEDFQRELARELKDWAGRPTALTFASALSRNWGAEVWLEARGPCAYRRTQDQQRAGPGVAGQAPRGAARHRGDGRRTARRRDGCCLCAPRTALRRLHGGRGHRAPGAECRAHEATRCRGRIRDGRRPDAARRDRRGAA